jgi:hypothetical protein
MKRRNRPDLCRLLEVDQQVAAADQVDVGERRIVQQIMAGKYQHLAQLRQDLEAPVAERLEVALAHVAGHVDEAVLPVAPHARLLQGFVVQVGGQYLQARLAAGGSEGLEKQNGDGIRFLAGGASAIPDADLLVFGHTFEQVRNHLGAQHLERLGVPEKRVTPISRSL